MALLHPPSWGNCMCISLKVAIAGDFHFKEAIVFTIPL